MFAKSMENSHAECISGLKMALKDVTLRSRGTVCESGVHVDTLECLNLGVSQQKAL